MTSIRVFAIIRNNLGNAATSFRKEGIATTENKPKQNEPAGNVAERLWTPVFILIVGLTLCCFLVGQGLNSGTSVYLTRVGGTATLAGIGAASFSAAAAIARLLAGPVIDSRGRMAVVATGGIVMLAGTVGPLLSNTGAPFILWRALQGVGFAAATTAAATAAADVLPASRLGEGIGYYGLGQAISMSIGPALALYLVSTDPPENLYIGTSLAAATVLVLALLVRYERHPESLPATCEYRRLRSANAANGAANCSEATEKASGLMPSERRVEAERPDETAGSPGVSPTGTNVKASASAPAALRRVFTVFEPRALPGTIPMLVLSPAFGFGIFFVGLYGASLGIGSSGLFYTVSAVAMIVIRLKSKAFMDTMPAIKIMAGAVFCGLVAYALLLASSALEAEAAREALFYLAGIPYGLSLGVALPVNQTVAVKNTPAERWGAANALYLLASDIGIGAASMVWGIVNDAFGFTTTICCVMACIAASLLVAQASYPPEDKRWKK